MSEIVIFSSANLAILRRRFRSLFTARSQCFFLQILEILDFRIVIAYKNTVWGAFGVLTLQAPLFRLRFLGFGALTFLRSALVPYIIIFSKIDKKTTKI